MEDLEIVVRKKMSMAKKAVLAVLSTAGGMALAFLSDVVEYLDFIAAYAQQNIPMISSYVDKETLKYISIGALVAIGIAKVYKKMRTKKIDPQDLGGQ